MLLLAPIARFYASQFIGSFVKVLAHPHPVYIQMSISPERKILIVFVFMHGVLFGYRYGTSCMYVLVCDCTMDDGVTHQAAACPH